MGEWEFLLTPGGEDSDDFGAVKSVNTVVEFGVVFGPALSEGSLELIDEISKNSDIVGGNEVIKK